MNSNTPIHLSIVETVCKATLKATPVTNKATATPSLLPPPVAMAPLEMPPALPGDCNVKAFIQEHVKPYLGDSSFLAPATERTLASWHRCEELMEEERVKGILDVDTVTPSTITSHAPGYVLSAEQDVIKGLQTDAPLKRSCKPLGGFRVVQSALRSYGYEADPSMEATYGAKGPVATHNDLVFAAYTAEMRYVKHDTRLVV